MTSWLLILGLGTLLVLLVVFIRRRGSASAMQQASEQLKPIMRIWAGYGPYASGGESMAHMQAAILTVMGEERGSDLFWSTFQHREAFDADPDRWNQLAEQQLARAPRPPLDVRAQFEERLIFVFNMHSIIKNLGSDMSDADKAAAFENMKKEKALGDALFKGIGEKMK